jgi:hypothetical protein
LRGTATVYNDLRTSGLAVRTQGSSDPTLNTYLGNLRLYEFSASTMNEVFITIQMPHGYKEGSNIEPHVHFSPNGTSGGNTRWGLEYTWTNMDGTFGAPTTVYVDATTGTTQHAHKYGSFGSISGTGKTISSVLVCRLFRDAANAADTNTNGSFLLEFDVHYEQDRIGSRTATAA